MQGQAVMVVEISQGFVNAKATLQNLRDGFLGSSFSGAARNANDALTPMATHGRRQPLHGGKRVIDEQQTFADPIAVVTT